MSEKKKLGDVKVKIEIDPAQVQEVLAQIREAMESPDVVIQAAVEVAEQRDEAVRLLAELVDALKSVLYTSMDGGKTLDHRAALLDVLTRNPAPEYYANELVAFVRRVDILIPAAAELAREVAKRKEIGRDIATAVLDQMGVE